MKINQFQNSSLLHKAEQNSWHLIPFNKVLIDETRLASKIKKEDYLAAGKYPIIDQGKKLVGGYSNEIKGLYNNKPYIIFGDHTRILKYIDFPTFIGADGVKLLKNIKSEEEVLTKYLYYFLETIDIPNTGYNRHFKFLKEVIIPIPSIKVQMKIVEVLDKAYELIEKRKAQIEALSSLTQSVFLEMFEDPITNPKNWSVKPLGDFLNKIDSGWSPKSESIPAMEGEKGVLKLSAVTKGVYRHSENKALFADTPFKEAFEVKNGDLLVTRKNTRELVGACAFVFNTPTNLMLPDTIFRLVFKPTQDNIHPIYLWRLLNNNRFRLRVTDLAEGSAGSMPNISKKNLLKLGIVVPPMELQKQFSEGIIKIEGQKELLKNGLLIFENNFQSLMQQAFNGELFND
ncbi:restriction endonuclease subunit S [Peribacillus sp. NPDC094092]|uniref:restriction endonuclease subunit S n=1 Tax=Peribacillus sp. NPDC094092 TaxID=3390611 RepID=UPI003D026D22